MTTLVRCENAGCKKRFLFTSPDDIVQAATVDEDGHEIGERQDIFACPSCQKKYAVIEEDEE